MIMSASLNVRGSTSLSLALRSGNMRSLSSWGKLGNSHSRVNLARLEYHHQVASQIPLASAWAMLSAQWTRVYTAVRLLMTRVIGSGFLAASRYWRIVSAICSTGRMIDNDSTPRPMLAATAAVLSLDAAIQHGGWGSWNGLGVTIRTGTLSMAGKSQYLPWNWKYSDSHACTTAWIASLACALLSTGSTPKADCSIGVDRPVPHSTLPLDNTSAVATFSATRTGEVNGCGINTTPKPSRIRSVTCDSAPISTSGAEECDRPSRKWCSTCQVV